MRISKGDVAVLQTSDLGLFWHDSCRYKVWAVVRVGQKVPRCVWGECDFHVNWLHVSRIHWRLNDDFDINQRRRRLTRNIHIGVCVCARVQLMSPGRRRRSLDALTTRTSTRCRHQNIELCPTVVFVRAPAADWRYWSSQPPASLPFCFPHSPPGSAPCPHVTWYL